MLFLLCWSRCRCPSPRVCLCWGLGFRVFSLGFRVGGHSGGSGSGDVCDHCCLLFLLSSISSQLHHPHQSQKGHCSFSSTGATISPFQVCYQPPALYSTVCHHRNRSAFLHANSSSMFDCYEFLRECPWGCQAGVVPQPS